MKRVEAFIKPFKADAIKDALQEAGVDLVMMSQMREFSDENRYVEAYAGTEYEVDERPRIWLLAFVQDADVDRVTGLIRTNAQTDTPLDGSIVISDVVQLCTLN
jgi:nitrogen regulatory protein PII